MHFKLAIGVALFGLAGVATAQGIDLMQFADGNGDGKVTPAEYVSFSQQTWDYFAPGSDKVEVSKLEPMGQAAVKGVQADAAGFVTKADYLASADARFKAADTDHDGTLSGAELNASMGNAP
jgi:hypothetical protein